MLFPERLVHIAFVDKFHIVEIDMLREFFRKESLKKAPGDILSSTISEIPHLIYNIIPYRPEIA
jgi:hypothetical protein